MPVRHNLDLYSSFYPTGAVAYDEGDCMQGTEKKALKSRKNNK